VSFEQHQYNIPVVALTSPLRKGPGQICQLPCRRIRNHPLVPATIPIYRFLYDVKNGPLVQVPEATEIGVAAEAA
jgi:hypothetical protein